MLRIQLGRSIREAFATADAAASLTHQVGIRSEALGEFVKWTDYNDTLITALFAPGTTTRLEYPIADVLQYGRTDALDVRARVAEADLDQELVWLDALLTKLDLYVEAAPHLPASPNELGDKIFVVHGRDARLQAVARVVQRLTGNDPVILRERPNQGRTIIEKFIEETSEAGFAIVIVTGDDEGRLRDGNEELRLRARQNVVLELGYFIGHLGRDRVAVLYEQGVEPPSDMSGVLYESLDSDAWPFKLGQELIAAGIDADLNNLA
jgi:predicted nucleotide-binding protein